MAGRPTGRKPCARTELPATVSTHAQRRSVVKPHAIGRINVANNSHMPPYGPDLPAPPIISDPSMLRRFILSKRTCSDPWPNGIAV